MRRPGSRQAAPDLPAPEPRQPSPPEPGATCPTGPASTCADGRGTSADPGSFDISSARFHPRRAAAASLVAVAFLLAGCDGDTRATAGGVGRCDVPFAGEVREGDTTSVALLRPDLTVERVLADDASEPALSPDGSVVAFIQRAVLPGSPPKERRMLTTMRSDGTGRRTPIVADDADHADPSWAPEGNRILFRRLDGKGSAGRGRYMTVDPLGGGNPRPLLRNDRDGAEYRSARFSPDGDEVVMTRRLGRIRDVVVADVATGAVVRGVAEGTSAAWSPDSAQIAVGGPGREVDGGIPRVEIRGRRAKTGTEVDDSRSASTEVLAWTARGVLYGRTIVEGVEPELWTVDAAGLTTTPLAGPPDDVRPTSVIPGC